MERLLNTKELADYLDLLTKQRVWYRRKGSLSENSRAVRFSEVEIQEILGKSRKEPIR